MHDYAMHTLWSYYVTCTIDQIHAIRTLFVTNEFSKKREVLEKPEYMNELKKVIERMQVSIIDKQKQNSFPYEENIENDTVKEMVGILQEMKKKLN